MTSRGNPLMRVSKEFKEFVEVIKKKRKIKTDAKVTEFLRMKLKKV